MTHPHTRVHWRRIFTACLAVLVLSSAGAMAASRPISSAAAAAATPVSSAAATASKVDNAWALAAGRDGKLVVAGISGKRREGRTQMALARYTARGRLDLSFGVGGKALTSFGSGNSSWAEAVAVQGDGKVVLAGGMQPGNQLTRFGLARYTKRGRLDPSFGQNGKVVTRFGAGRSISTATALAIQPDGKLVAFGSWSRAPFDDPARFTLARYTSLGRLDPTFGHGGKVLTSLGGRSNAQPAALLIQPDGKLVAVGTYFGRGFAVALARYRSDGRLDPSFGTDGQVVSKVAEGANAAVLQPDGKIVVSAGGRSGPLLVRYTGDGKLDRSFGAGGEAVIRLDAPSALALQRDGRIVVSGWTDAGHRVFAVSRYLPKGSLDASFGRGGEARADFGSHAVLHAATVQADGKIAAAGTRASKDFAVARYTSSGRLDPSFGVGGKVTTDFGSVWGTR